MTREDLENKGIVITPFLIASVLWEVKARLLGIIDSPLDESIAEIAINKQPLLIDKRS